ncbi:COP23 domain-containing protein [Lusitaniella coriacea]|uniref:COP23 domain-containing protein n=1 Tax=Lusitaniella coriacea TaxID=1983105 RepID=UPI003CF7BEE0
MQSQQSNSLGKSVAFSLAAVVLASQGSAVAQIPIQLGQNSSEEPDVVIDSGSEANDSPRFTCELVNGQYTVTYNPENQPGEGYPWAVPSEMGGGWTPQNRCLAISQRLESYRSDGLLEMRTAIENNYDTVCVTTEADGRCRIVFTVPRGQDPVATRDRVFENLTIADSGQTTQGVNTYTGNRSEIDVFNQIGQVLTGNSSILGNLGNISNPSLSNGINLKPFLAPSDGGTGEKLIRGLSPASQPRRLNPGSFR